MKKPRIIDRDFLLLVWKHISLQFFKCIHLLINDYWVSQVEQLLYHGCHCVYGRATTTTTMTDHQHNLTVK